MAQNITISPSIERAQYDRLTELIAKQMGLTVDQFTGMYKVMPYTLKMAAYLQPGTSQYNMSPRKGVDNNGIPNVSLLDQNDWMAITGISLRVGKCDFASNAASNWGTYPQFTYPDPNYFSGTGTAVGSEAASLQTLVNGYFAMYVQGDSQVDPTPAQEYFFNPMSTYTSSPVAYPQFGGDTILDKGYLPQVPNLIIDASADNTFQVSLAVGAKLNIDGAISTGTTDSGKRNILYIVATGFKIKNLGGQGASLTCNRV